ncbi:DNA binding protein Ncp1 [Mycena kentingensis (nom. inval.)]|nr:DNA binding protein Ncp1 [Mycena kentingensis (nom. inval.)]
MPPNLLRRIPSSLKLLLSSPARDTKQRAFTSLPDDVLLEIVLHLGSHTLLSLALTNTRYFALLSPTLYTELDLHSSSQCQETLSFLLNNANVYARHVRKLTVRPNNKEWHTQTESSRPDIESWVAVTIAQLAEYLINLRSFVWDGTAFPKFDNLWTSLAKHCLELKHVGATIGSGDFTFRQRKVMPVKSPLFRFENLVGFTLRVKQNVASSLHPPFDELPQELFEMLYRCENLQHLTIDTDNERYIDLRPVFEGHWPELRDLTIGDFVLLDSFGTVEGTNNGLAMTNFLARHPSLERLTLHQLEGWYFPLSLHLPPDSLPNLRHFSARHTLLRTVQPLESLELTNQPLGTFPLIGALWAISQLPLTSLRIWVDFSDSEETNEKIDHTKPFVDILQAAPGLLDLDIFCSSDPSFTMSEMSIALATPHRLRSLVLTQVKKQPLRESDTLRDALMLFRQSATLRNLKLSDVAARWRHPRDLRLHKVSRFEVVGIQPTGVVLAVHQVGCNRRSQRTVRTFRHLLKVPINAFLSSYYHHCKVYYDAMSTPAQSPTPEPPTDSILNVRIVESPTSEAAPADTPTPTPSPRGSMLSPVIETDAENVTSPDLAATAATAAVTATPGTSPTSSVQQKAAHARAASLAQRSIFSNADGQSVSGSTFINGAGTTGPHAVAEHGESLHFRAASANATLSEEQRARIAKTESKSNKQIAKVVKAEAKLEKKALDVAVNELAILQKMQKTAVKREEKAQSTYNKSLSTFQKHEAAFLAARAKFEASQALLTANTDTLEISRSNAKQATEKLQDKAQEVDGLRTVFDVDEKEREVKLVELTGKGSTRKRWSIIG